MSIKALFKILAGIVIVLFLILMGLYLFPPGQKEYQYLPVEYVKDQYSDKVGWYEDDNQRWYQVTWSSNGGLRLNYIDSLRPESYSLNIVEEQGRFFIDQQGSNNQVSFTSVDSSGYKLEFRNEGVSVKALKREAFYIQEEIRYFNATIPLVGTLFTPIHNDQKVLVVFIHGSGHSDRDNMWYMYQADWLAKKGYTVLLPDKRGCGKSQGEWHIASFSDFANDIVAGFNYFDENDHFRDYRKGVIGLSQGGWISHLVPEKYDELDFVIDVVSSATTPGDQVYFEIKRDFEDAGVPQLFSGLLSIVFSKRAMGKRKIWWGHNRDYDPISMLRNTKVPVLKVFGSDDKNVPVELSLHNLNLLFREQPELPVTVKVFQGSGHGLFSESTNWVREDYLQLLDQWLNIPKRTQKNIEL